VARCSADAHQPVEIKGNWYCRICNVAILPPREKKRVSSKAPHNDPDRRPGHA